MIGLGMEVGEPDMTHEYGGDFDADEQVTFPMTQSGSFMLEAGEYTLHVLVYNESGNPLISDMLLTAIIFEE